jgi:hypothetical protein
MGPEVEPVRPSRHGAKAAAEAVLGLEQDDVPIAQGPRGREPGDAPTDHDDLRVHAGISPGGALTCPGYGFYTQKVERAFHDMGDAVSLRTGTQSIERAAQLLVHVVESKDAPTVGELALATGLPKSTTSRVVGALERQGLLQRDSERGSLRAGPVLLRFARREPARPDLVELATPALDRLAAASGETVNLGSAPRTGSAGGCRTTRPRWGRSFSPSARCRYRPGR